MAGLELATEVKDSAEIHTPVCIATCISAHPFTNHNQKNVTLSRCTPREGRGLITMHTSDEADPFPPWETRDMRSNCELCWFRCGQVTGSEDHRGRRYRQVTNQVPGRVTGQRAGDTIRRMGCHFMEMIPFS